MAAVSSFQDIRGKGNPRDGSERSINPIVAALIVLATHALEVISLATWKIRAQDWGTLTLSLGQTSRESKPSVSDPFEVSRLAVRVKGGSCNQ